MTRTEKEEIKTKIKTVIELNNNINQQQNLHLQDLFLIELNLPADLLIKFIFIYDKHTKRLSVKRKEFKIDSEYEYSYTEYVRYSFDKFVSEFEERIGIIDKFIVSLDQEIIGLV